MNKVKQLMNKITDKGTTVDPSSAVGHQSFESGRDDQVSAEGFLCPDCMTAFPSPEVLAEHYTTKHTVAAAETSPDLDESDIFNLAMEQSHLLELRCALEAERKQSKDLQRELVNVRNENESRKGSLASLKSQFETEAYYLREECVQLRKQSEESKLKYNKANIDLESLKATNGKDTKVLQESLTSLREELTQAQMSEAECQDLRLEAQRLQDQHSELVGRLEGDEGTQAVVDSLTNERITLTTKLETTQVQNRELSKNLHNIGIELEKLQNELATITAQLDDHKKKVENDKVAHRNEIAQKNELLETASKAHAQSQAMMSSMQNQLTNQASEIKDLKATILQAKEAVESLEKTVAQRSEEIVSLRGIIEKLTIEVDSATKKWSTAETIIADLLQSDASKSKEFEDVQSENASLQLANESVHELLQEQSRAFNRYLADFTGVLGLSQLEPTKNQADFDAYQEYSGTIVKMMSDKILSMKENQQAVQSQLEKRNAEIRDSTTQIENFRVRNNELETEMKCQKVEDAAELETLRRDIDQNRLVFEEKLKSAKTFEEQVDQLKEEITTVQTESKKWQDERDNLQAERLELDKKYKSSEEARSMLLERCLAGESEAEKFNDTMQGLQRKLADALAALQELGRENQSLQVEFAKVQGRKWTDDSNVTSCSTCSKEFSITVRKHHCRVCGKIFCHECSSKTASIPSSKKPVRVCEACAEELAK